MNVSVLQLVTKNFLHELQAGRDRKKTNLAFIRHHLSLHPYVPDNVAFQVIRIGGSIYQKAMVQREAGKMKIIASVQGRLPLFSSLALFLSFIEENLDKQASVVALNFAYPLSPVTRNGLLDGVLQAGTKEHTFTGLVGKAVGKTIEEYVAYQLRRKIRVTLANDTICLSLSGLTQFPWQGLVGGIVGTGQNFALFLDEHTLVNLESARFDRFEQSPQGKIIDAQSASPGTNLFEKETAGGYLYQHFNLKMQKLGIEYKKLSSTKELDVVANQNDGSQATRIAQDISKRSASLIACQIAGITLFHKRDCTFVIEGSLFWRGWQYKDNVAFYCQKLAPDYQVNFVFIKDSGILGAAQLLT